MSFLDRAKQAAEQAKQAAGSAAGQARQVAGQAAEQAKQVAEQAAEQAKQVAEQAQHAATEGTDRAQAMLHDPANAEKARHMMSRAKQGIATAIDRIDPAVLAEIIVKATALQERANAALRAKGSPYRISEVSIGAAIPPSVTFAIARSDDPAGEEPPAGTTSSVAIVAAEKESTGAIMALDGSVIEEPVVGSDSP